MRAGSVESAVAEHKSTPPPPSAPGGGRVCFLWGVGVEVAIYAR